MGEAVRIRIIADLPTADQSQNKDGGSIADYIGMEFDAGKVDDEPGRLCVQFPEPLGQSIVNPGEWEEVK